MKFLDQPNIEYNRNCVYLIPEPGNDPYFMYMLDFCTAIKYALCRVPKGMPFTVLIWLT